MKRILYQKTNLCSGCLSCQTVCSLAQCGEYHPESSCIRIELRPFTGSHQAAFCRQCSDAACAKNCPTKAIKYHREKKYWSIDYSICITCQTCISKCPYDAIFYDEIHSKVIKCNTCEGAFLCVEACKFGVLEYENEYGCEP